MALVGATLIVARPPGSYNLALLVNPDNDCNILADAWEAMGGRKMENEYCVGRSVGPRVSFDNAGYVTKMYAFNIDIGLAQTFGLLRLYLINLWI